MTLDTRLEVLVIETGYTWLQFRLIIRSLMIVGKRLKMIFNFDSSIFGNFKIVLNVDYTRGLTNSNLPCRSMKLRIIDNSFVNII